MVERTLWIGAAVLFISANASIIPESIFSDITSMVVTSTPGPSVTHSPMERLALKTAFELCDTDKDGRMTKDDIRRMMDNLRRPYSNAGVDELFDSMDLDKNGTVELEEYLQYMLGRNREDDAAKSFGIFDLDGDGYVTKEELETVMKRIGRPFSKLQLAAMMLADTDGDGKISFKEYVTAHKAARKIYRSS